MPISEEGSTGGSCFATARRFAWIASRVFADIMRRQGCREGSDSLRVKPQMLRAFIAYRNPRKTLEVHYYFLRILGYSGYGEGPESAVLDVGMKVKRYLEASRALGLDVKDGT